MNLLIILLIAIAALALLLVWMGLRRQRHRRKGIAQRAWKQWAELPHIADPSRRVLEAENILDRVLREIGYQGTFGEKLRKMQKTLPNIDAVWVAHKLRNRIAHEPGIHVSDAEAEKAIHAFTTMLKKILPLQPNTSP